MIKARLIKISVLLGIFVLAFSTVTITKIYSPDKLAQEELSDIKIIRYVGVGDNLIHDAVYSWANKLAGGDGKVTGTTGEKEFNFLPMYSGIADIIKNADVASINQETIPGGDELGITSYPCFNSPRKLIYDMKELGFDIFSHATNHTYDKGSRGVKGAYEFYETFNGEIVAPGIYKKGERNFRTLTKNGIKLGLVSYTEMTNGITLPESAEYYAPLLDDENLIISDLLYAKENSDFVIAYLHWGNEYQFEPSSKQRETAELFAKNGADIIIGTHPHVIQPVEYIGDVPVIYSLGNFMSAQVDKYNMVEGLISFDIIKTPQDTFLDNLTFVPIINYYTTGFTGFNVYTLSDYKEKGLENTHKLGVTAEYAEKLINQVVDPRYLPQ